MKRLAIGALAAAVALVTAAPLLAAVAGPAAWPLYAAFAWICHQRPERSWFLAGYPLAVCVRCLGLYAGALAGLVAGRPFSRRLALAAAVALAAEWGAEAAGWAGTLEGLRFATGGAAGFFLAPAVLPEQGRPPARILKVGKEVQA